MAMEDGFKYPWPFPKQASRWYTLKSRITMTAVYICAKFMFTGCNKLIVRNRETFLRLLDDKSRPLLTYSNHRCNIDDPLVWAIIPADVFFKNIDRFRYTPTAHNICFTNAFYTALFSLGRCVPVVRGAGVFQKCVDFCIEKLNEKAWVHMYPEGKVVLQDEPIRFKWGIGRIINETKEPPILLPIWVNGMNQVWPNKSPYYPKFGKTVEVIIGDPIDSTDLMSTIKGKTEIERRKEITDITQRTLFDLGGYHGLKK